MKKVLFLGYCGSIRETIGVGEVILPTHSMREEGHHIIASKGVSCYADEDIQSLVHKGLMECGIEPYVGMSWSTGALYRETAEKIKRYRSKGLLGVDMETSAVFCLGVY